MAIKFKLYILFILFSILGNLHGAQVYMTFYEGIDYTGRSRTLYNTDKNFNDGPFLSMCYIGSWEFTLNTQLSTTYTLYPYSSKSCQKTSTSELIKTATHYGPLDTTTKAIILEGKIEALDATVYVANGTLGINKGFSDTYVRTSGRSSWELFEGDNFTGKSLCLKPNAELNRYTLDEIGVTRVGSVVRGCCS